MSPEIRDLIRRMSLANPLWGAPRIHGELLKLGIEVSQATVGRYLPWRPKVFGKTFSSRRATMKGRSISTSGMSAKGFSNAAQVMLVQDDDVIQTFAADRADEALDIEILPG